MKFKLNPIDDAFGTKNVKEQLQILERLKLAARSPVIDFIIRLDPRTGDIQLIIIGGDIDSSIAKALLKAAEEKIHQAELEGVKRQILQKEANDATSTEQSTIGETDGAEPTASQD